MSRLFTHEDISAAVANTYWLREKLGSCESITAREIAKLGIIPDDRIWLLMALLPADEDKRLFACWCVRQIWYLLADKRSRVAVETAERYAAGNASDEELFAAWGAAWDAARETTARTAIRDVTRAATCAAARTAFLAAWGSWRDTWAGTWGAANAATRAVLSAANEAARPAAQQKQLDELVRLHEDRT